jgi:O-antigen/teichoic acid export membrane protein
LRARLLRGVGWNLVTTVFGQGSTFVLNLVLANVWGLRTFGQFAMVQSTITALTAGAQAIVATTATRYAAELRVRDRQRAGRVLGLNGLVALGLAGAAAAGVIGGSRWIAADVLADPTLATAMATVGAVVSFTIVSGFLTGALAGLEAYPRLGRTAVATGTLYVALGAAAGFRWGVTGAVGGLAVAALVQGVLLGRGMFSEAAAQGIAVRGRGAGREIGVLVRFLAPSAVNSLIAYPVLWGANALLVRSADGYQQLALFSAANNLRILVLFFPAIVNNVTLSLLNHQRGADEEQRFRRLFWLNAGLTSGAVAAGALVVAAAGPWLLGAFGREFQAGYQVLLILMLSTLPEAMIASAIQIAQSREKMWLWCAAVVVPCYGSLIVLAVILTGPLGARGLAWSYAGAMAVGLIAALVVVGRLGIWVDSGRASAGLAAESDRG